MKVVSVEQARRHRLRAHHLDRAYGIEDAAELAGACGMQNTPPGAWETALFNRAPACRREDAERLLYGEKTLVQAWSLRGAPWCSPRPKARRSCRRSFRRRASRGRTRRASALRSMRWAWSSTGCSNCSCGRCRASTTRRSRARWRSIKRWRIGSSRCFLRTSARRGDSRRCTAAPTSRRWEEPRCRSCCARARSWASSCSASAPAQRPRSPRTEGGRAARCSRTLTPPRVWCGSSSIATGRRGPMRSRPGRGCSGAQARRMWKGIADELEPVEFGGKKAWALAADLDALASAEPPEREVLLLAGHDPYLDQRDRATLQVDVSLQRRIWKTVANPGVVVRNGEAVGTWTAKKKGAGLSVSLATWVACSEQKLRDLAEALRRLSGFEAVGRELRVASRLVPRNIANARFPDSMCGKIVVLARRARSEAVFRNTVGTRAGVSPGRFPEKGVEAVETAKTTILPHIALRKVRRDAGCGRAYAFMEDLPKRSTGAGKE